MKKDMIVTLHLAKPSNNMQISYVNAFNKPEIVRTMKNLVGLLRNSRIEYSSDSDPRMVSAMSMLTSDFSGGQSQLKKAEVVALHVSFSQDENNIINLVRSNEKLLKAWKEIIENVDVPVRDIAKTVGFQPEIVTDSSYYSSKILIDLAFDGVDIGNYDRYSFGSVSRQYDRLTFWASQKVRMSMAEAIMPAGFLEGSVLKELPAGSNLRVENFSDDLPEEFLYLSGLKSSGTIPKKDATITAATLKTLGKRIKLRDFALIKHDTEIARGPLVLVAYLQYAWSCSATDPLGSSIDKFAKFVATKLATKLEGTKFGIFLPRYNGFTKAWAKDSRAKSIVELAQSLLKPAAEGWFSLDNFNIKYLCNDKLVSPLYAYTALFGEESRRVHQLKRKGIDNYYRTPDVDWFNDITFPFVVGWMYLLCACGMAELAVDPQPKGDDPMQGLRYIRLTALGRYAFGIDKKYKSNVNTTVKEMFDVDPSGVITILQSPCPYETFLRRIGKDIGGNRFVVTAKTLVAASESEKDVLEDIGKIKNIFRDDTTGYWKQVMEEAKKRARCGARIEAYYNLMKFDPEVPGLMDFLMSSAWVREHCVKAEGNMLLVSAGEYTNLLKMLGEEGYIY